MALALHAILYKPPSAQFLARLRRQDHFVQLVQTNTKFEAILSEPSPAARLCGVGASLPQLWRTRAPVAVEQGVDLAPCNAALGELRHLTHSSRLAI